MGKNKGNKSVKHEGVEGQMESVQQETTSVSEQASEAPTSTGMTQREAVYKAVKSVMDEGGITHDPSVGVKPLLSPELLNKVYAELASGFQAGQISLKATEGNQRKLAEPKLLEVYIIGLVNNWLRRDPRLNGRPKASS